MARAGALRPSRPSSPRGCCGKLRKKCPLDKTLIKVYVIGIVAVFGSAFAITMLFPFLPFMIKFLIPQLDEESVGKYAGIVASSMFFGRFLGSYIWGSIADSKGRKPVLVVSNILLGLSSLAFGFSIHIAMAVAFRFSVGLTNGIVGTMKAVIAEASDDRTQAFGVTVLTTAWGLGFIIGPALSGAIADPIGQYNLTISNPVIRGFLTRFPYSLPCIVNFLLCLVAAILVALFLPETLGMKRKKKQEEDLLEEDASSDTVEQSQEEGAASDLQTDTQSLHDDSDDSHDDVDLGTLGRRPFAQRDDASVIQRSTALEVIVESPEHSDVESVDSEPKPKSETDQESRELLVNQAASVLSVQPSSNGSDGGAGDSASPSLGRTGSSGDFKLVSGLRFSRGFGDARPEPEDAEVEEVDLGELRPSKLEHSDSLLDGADALPQPSIEKGATGHKPPLRKQRKRSFLIPFFNRRESFTPSFVKPSLSALRHKFRRRAGKRDTLSREGESQEFSDVSSEQEEIEMEGEAASAGESEEEGLLEEPGDREAESESSWFRRKLKRFGKSLKTALYDLKLFLCDRGTSLALLTYCTFSFGVIGYEEVYSLWAATSPDLGGIGFTLHEIGTSLAVVGVLLLPFLFFLYPMMERRFGSIKSFQLCATVGLVVVVLLPNIHYLVTSGQKIWLWGILCTSQLILRICIGVSFGATTLLINNSVTFDKLGAVNGLAVSLTAFFRTVAPVFSGSIYSTSLSASNRATGFPLDYHLIFVIFSVVFLSSVLMASCLPERVNRQKVEEE